MIRVRFAPSPTGYLHIGGVRTALFNFLWARHTNGKFLVRIEDTDRERSRGEYEKEILDSLRWLGLDSDEPRVYQSMRLDRYRVLAQELLARGLAYEEMRGADIAIRLRLAKEDILFTDLVHGEVRFGAECVEDLVLLKSDGYPTYHFACVVDDHDMQISHVIRGYDHLSNTPKQLMIHRALDWTPPAYAHLPLILGEDGAPLSKRHGAVAVSEYRRAGYWPGALLNYLALLGWSPGDNREILSPDEMIESFDLKKINKASARFDREKLDWMNAQRLKQFSDDDFAGMLRAFYPDWVPRYSPEAWGKIAGLYKTRVRTLAEFSSQADYLFAEIPAHDPAAASDILRQAAILKPLLAEWCRRAEMLAPFEDLAALEAMTRGVAEEGGVRAKDLIQPLRFALTAKKATPGLFEIMALLGKPASLARVKKFTETCLS